MDISTRPQDDPDSPEAHQEQSRRDFERRLSQFGFDVTDFADKERRLREAHPDEIPIIETSRTVETQIYDALRAGRDTLTGALNLKGYREEVKRLEANFDAEAQHRRRKHEVILDTPFSIITFDVDHFKRINDIFGHHAGDQVLQEIARRVNVNLRQGDLFARCGGEEFHIVALTANGFAPKLAERIRRSIADEPFVIKDNTEQERKITVTISLGVASYDSDTKSTEVRSDAALYGAKGNDRSPRDQRNQVWVWDSVLGKPVPCAPQKRPREKPTGHGTEATAAEA